MAEVPPIQKTVDPKLSITSAEQALALEKAFDETFGPIGDKAPDEPKESVRPESATAAETDLPPEETPAEETPPSEENAPQGEPAVSAPGADAAREVARHPDDEADEEVDRFKLHPSSTPETLATFRELRGALKTQRKESAALRERIAKHEAEASGTPRPVNDPAVQKEIEQLRNFWQRHQIFDDSSYQAQYENPVHDQFNAIIEDIKAISNDAQAAEEWEKAMRSSGPDKLDKRYWNEGVIAQISDPLDRDRLLRKVASLIELQDRRNSFRKQMAEEPDAYAKFQHQQAAEYWDNFGKEAQDEMTKVTPTLGEWASPKDLKTAKNATEKTAMEAHNKVYAEYEELFKKYINDAATQGPRGMARVSAMAVYAEKRGKDLEAANKKITKLQADLAKAQEELNKIAGARSRVAQPSSAGPNGQPPPQGKRKASQSVERAFDEFFGKA